MTDYGICLEPNCNDDGNQELPPFIDMAKALLGSAKDIVSGAVQGEGVLVTEDVYNNRISICSSCEFFRKEDKRCTKCGCFMEAKTRFKKTHCPVNKWEKLND